MRGRGYGKKGGREEGKGVWKKGREGGCKENKGEREGYGDNREGGREEETKGGRV